MWLAHWLSLRLTGGAGVRVVSRDDFSWSTRAFDGLIVGGGDDISAELYGGEPVPAVRIDEARDRLELAALDHFLPTGKPVLGVCRGAQLLNVALGGNLHQDIYTAYPGAKRVRSVLPRKTIRVASGTLLHELTDEPTMHVNSLHHQSIDNLGEGLRVSATDEFNIVQAVEMRETSQPFRLGVQWHPEFLPWIGGHRRIFDGLIEAAARASVSSG